MDWGHVLKVIVSDATVLYIMLYKKHSRKRVDFAVRGNCRSNFNVY